MHEYVQKSTRTTLPCNDCRDSARPPGGGSCVGRAGRAAARPPGVLSHWEMPVKSGALPSFGNDDRCGAAAAAFAAKAVWRPRRELGCFCAVPVSSTCFWMDVV